MILDVFKEKVLLPDGQIAVDKGEKMLALLQRPTVEELTEKDGRQIDRAVLNAGKLNGKLQKSFNLLNVDFFCL